MKILIFALALFAISFVGNYEFSNNSLIESAIAAGGEDDELEEWRQCADDGQYCYDECICTEGNTDCTPSDCPIDPVQ